MEAIRLRFAKNCDQSMSTRHTMSDRDHRLLASLREHHGSTFRGRVVHSCPADDPTQPGLFALTRPRANATCDRRGQFEGVRTEPHGCAVATGAGKKRLPDNIVKFL